MSRPMLLLMLMLFFVFYDINATTTLIECVEGGAALTLWSRDNSNNCITAFEMCQGATLISLAGSVSRSPYGLELLTMESN